MFIEGPQKSICEICGGLHTTTQHPGEKESEGTGEAEKKEELRSEYRKLVNEYQRSYREIRKLERKHPPERRDETVRFEITHIDEERHQAHLKLISIAERLGKTKEDVLIDIIRWEKSLEEFGLPEFFILKSTDIVYTDNLAGTQFNITIKSNLNLNLFPERQTVLDEPFWEKTEVPENEFDRADYFERKQFAEENFKPVIDNDEVLLVFSVHTIVPRKGTPRTLGDLVENYSPDYNERQYRAKELAKKVSGKFFDHIQGSFHETDARVVGVVIPKKDLEKVAGIIRDNPKQFRLGEEFYNRATNE